VERLGNEFLLSERYRDAVLEAMDEYPNNTAMFEIVSRCPDLRASYARLVNTLRRSSEALEEVRKSVLQAPAARVETNMACVGVGSAIQFRVHDSDAYFLEADIFRAVLEVLLSPECRHLPKLAAAAVAGPSDSGSSLRKVCVLVADICDRLHLYPLPLCRATVFLSSAVRWCCVRDHEQINLEVFTLVHMVVSSRYCGFLQDVLSACSKSRMHDAADLQAVRDEIFGQGRPDDDRRIGRIADADVRLLLCHVLLLIFQIVFVLHQPGPERFVSRAAVLLRSRLVPSLHTVLQGALSNRWIGIRSAVNALVTLADQTPASTDIPSVHGSCDKFISFIVDKFLVLEGTTSREAALSALDPFGGCAAVDSQVHARSKETTPRVGTVSPTPWLPPSPLSSSPQRPALDVKARRGIKLEASPTWQSGHQRDDIVAVSGPTPPRQPPAPAGRDPKALIPRSLQVPSARNSLPWPGLPPLAGARGFFLNPVTMEVVR